MIKCLLKCIENLINYSCDKPLIIIKSIHKYFTLLCVFVNENITHSTEKTFFHRRHKCVFEFQDVYEPGVWHKSNVTKMFHHNGRKKPFPCFDRVFPCGVSKLIDGGSDDSTPDICRAFPLYEQSYVHTFYFFFQTIFRRSSRKSKKNVHIIFVYTSNN